MGKCHELYPCLEQVQHSFTEYKSYMYMFKSLSQFNYLQMALVPSSGAGTAFPSGENEFTQGFNGVHIARSLVSWGRGGNPPFHIGPLCAPIFLGSVVQKKYS